VRDPALSRWVRWLSFERCVAIGLVLIALGLAGTILALTHWGETGFGNLDPRGTIRLVLPSATAIALGVIGVFAGLFASLLTLRGVRTATTLTERIPRQRTNDRTPRLDRLTRAEAFSLDAARAAVHQPIPYVAAPTAS
jgi:hypothetical protein